VKFARNAILPIFEIKVNKTTLDTFNIFHVQRIFFIISVNENFVVIGQTVAELWQFIGFQDVCRPPSLVFKIRIFLQFVELRCPICLILPNFISVGQYITEIRRFFYFQNDGRPPS